MRIVGGVHKGRKIMAPEGVQVRPTTDRVRESVFNVLTHGSFLKDGLGGLRVLDLFAGTGALGLEAISRGAAFVCFVENAAASRAAIRKNIEAMHLTGQTKLYRRDATDLTEKPGNIKPFDLVFLDPPYGRELGPLALTSATQYGWVTDTARAILELSSKEDVPTIDGWAQHDTRVYGDTQLSFFDRKPA